MGKQITLGHAISFIVGILIPILIWGVGVERSIAKSRAEIENNKKEIEELKGNYKTLKITIDDNHKELINGIHSLDLKLKDKANRK